MPEDREEFIAKGPSTRAVQLRGEDYLVTFAKEALLDMAEQVRSGYVKMNVDHLSYLPPIGYWHGAEVVDDAEGHSELVMFGHPLSSRAATDTVLPAAGPRDAPPGPEFIPDVQIMLEPRNFEPDDWQRLSDESPLPVHEQAAWSLLPPLIWLITIPVVWGVTQFAGGFLNRLGAATAEGLINWLQTHARQARDNSRDSLIEVRFEIAPNLNVSAFIVFDAHTKDTVDELRQGLEGLGSVASFAGWMTGNDHPAGVRLVTFIYANEDWNLAWWATEDSAFVTNWFRKNCPDPKRFLGRPLLGVSDETPQRLIVQSESGVSDDKSE
jgi:hypothetical protein